VPRLGPTNVQACKPKSPPPRTPPPPPPPPLSHTPTHQEPRRAQPRTQPRRAPQRAPLSWQLLPPQTLLSRRGWWRLAARLRPGQRRARRPRQRGRWRGWCCPRRQTRRQGCPPGHQTDLHPNMHARWSGREQAADCNADNTQHLVGGGCPPCASATHTHGTHLRRRQGLQARRPQARASQMPSSSQMPGKASWRRRALPGGRQLPLGWRWRWLRAG